MYNSEEEIVVKPFPNDVSSKTLTAPASPDKSLTHRAILLAAMAKGVSTIRNPLTGEDCLATKKALEACGVEFASSQDELGRMVWTISSPGADGLRPPAAPLDLGNSGTAARLLSGMLAGLPAMLCTITGDDSLRRRPMERVVGPLREMGGQLNYCQTSETLPLTITGRRLQGRKHVFAVPSAQVKSSLIFAGLSAQGETAIELPAGSRDHTEIMVQHLGANIKCTRRGGVERISVFGPWRPPAFDCEIPTDPSSVAFFAALGALHPGLTVQAEQVLQNPTRTGLYDKLSQMGIEIRWSRRQNTSRWMGEAISDLRVQRHKGVGLSAVHVNADEVATMIDEIPLLAVIAAFADGKSMFKGLRELRVKESDRLSQIYQLLAAAGVNVCVGPDWLEVEGKSQRSVNAFSFCSEDHRLVMAAMILATKASGLSKISGLSWIKTSFPLFLRAFQNINSGIK